MHSLRKTELSTTRAAGLSPKEMFDRPRVVWTSGRSALDLADRLDRLDAVPSGLLLAGGDREGQAVDDDVAARGCPQLPVRSLDQPVGDLDLPLGRTRLALLVDGQRDHRRAVLHDQRHDPGEPGVRAVAVLVVDRVDHRAAAEPLQPGLQHRRLGRVQHDRQGRGGGQPEGEFAHVGGARRGRRSRRSGRAGGRRRGSGRGRCRRSRPSAPPAARRGRPWSRWRWSARRWTGSWCPAGTAPRRRGRRAAAR